jgi:hypothetical protein
LYGFFEWPLLVDISPKLQDSTNTSVWGFVFVEPLFYATFSSSYDYGRGSGYIFCGFRKRFSIVSRDD